MVYPPASCSLSNINNNIQLSKIAYAKGLLSSAIKVYRARILMRSYYGHSNTHWMLSVMEKSYLEKKTIH